MFKTKPISTLVAVGCTAFSSVHAAPLLTGVIEDVAAQTIEMPSLPGGWQRRIEWMADEGEEVAAGDLVVRLDPGTLIGEEEKARSDLEKIRFTATRSVDEAELSVLDGEQDLSYATMRQKVAALDATIPAETIPRLDYDRYQLTLETANQMLARTEQELANRRQKLRDAKAEAALDIEQAEVEYQRIADALAATEIRAEKGGFVIYAENPFTGRKIFPGDTLYGGLQIVSIASREDLQVRFWIHEADYLQFAQGKTLEVSADAQGIPSFPAVIAWRSSQALDKQDWSDSGYFEAYAEPMVALPSEIMPGMSVLGVPSQEVE
ncbi:MAG: hypothetical protein AAF578_14065 [Pseudomonadota bacterium]